MRWFFVKFALYMRYQEYIHPGPFAFEAGGTLENIHIAFHTSERAYRPGDKVVLVCHPLTADSNLEEWWPGLVGPGKFIDPEKYFVFCVNMLGSCYGSEGPGSINPATGKPYYFSFPKVTVRDIARAISLVRRHLGIPVIDLLIGCSIGGFQALELAIMEPDTIRKAVFMATTSRVSPWLSAFEETQRMALEADPSFRAAENLDGGKAGLRCARTVALLSYRCDLGYNARQGETDLDVMFPQRASRYHQYQGEKFVEHFNAYSYWYLSYAVDSVNVGRGRGGVEKALGRITAETLVLSFETDLIFPPHDMVHIAEAIPGARYAEIPTIFGHDGFLIETEKIAELARPMLETL